MSSIAIERVDDIEARYEPRLWPWSVAEAAQIDRYWAALAARNPALYDGRVLLQHGSDLVEAGRRRVFRAAYLETQFRSFLAWRDFDFPDRTVVNGFAMAALRSAEGAFVLGRMAAHTANAGRIYFAAGTPDPSDVREGRVDLEGSIMRELGEETGLAAADVTLEPGWTLVRDGQRLACMKIAQSPLPAAALVGVIETHLAAQTTPELASMVVVRTADDLDDAMQPFTRAYLRWALATSPSR